MNNRIKSKSVFLKLLNCCLLCGIIIIFVTIALKTDTEISKKIEKQSLSFNAEIIEIRETSVLVEKLSDRSEMLVNIPQASDSLAIEDVISIKYNGNVKETMPPVITAISIKVLKK